jgi:biopolymer transport protein ExbB
LLQDALLAFALLGATWVLWLLVGLSVLCVGVSLERVAFLARDGTPRATLADAVRGFVESGDVAAFHTQLRALDGFEARVLSSALEVAPRGTEAAQRALAGAILAEKLRMERGLAILATVGSNAPFVGLFGTVLGIIQAFHDLAISNAEASEAVMSGISEALVATAVGLVVAIPAVVLYNAFTRWNRTRIGRVESLGNLVLARLAPAPPAAATDDVPALAHHGR